MVVGRECLAANTGWLAARQRSGSGGLFQMVLVNLLPLVQFVFITLLLPEPQMELAISHAMAWSPSRRLIRYCPSQL